MLYKYCKTDGFDILLKARLLASRLENINDPFELVFGVDRDDASESIRKELEEDQNLTRAWFHILDEQKISYDKNYLDDIVDKLTQFQIADFERAAQKIWMLWKENMGIVCLSKSADIIQMWAHYTDNHKGIVVGLDENEFIQDKMQLVKVCYQDDMALLPVTAVPEKAKQYEKYFADVIRRKERMWLYEKEVRLYLDLEEKNTNGNYYVNIPPASITELYLGLRAEETTEIIAKSIKERKEYAHLKIYRMEKHEKVFKLLARKL